MPVLLFALQSAVGSAGRSRVLFPVRAGDFSLLKNVQTSSRTHLAFYSICTGDSFPVG